MDDTTSASSASSSASESDAYNTESARLYFGPVNTPERKFVANKLHLFPLQVSYPLRRSPRLSSPRPHPPNTSSAIDQESSAQEDKDIDLVAELVSEVEVEDDEQMPYPLVGTPPRVEEMEQDEPLSALADKILHAVDNPSPPPSPATALKMFDPYHPANASDSGEYEGDLLFPHAMQETVQDDYPLAKLSDPCDASKSEPLIVFDSPNQFPGFNHIESSNAPHETMSVDDLLANSPDSTPFHQPALNREPSLIEEPQSRADTDDLMSVDSANKAPEEELAFPSSETQERRTPDRASVPVQQPPTEDAIVTPLRRSMRPRKSVAPTPSPQPPPVVTVPSPARTCIKRKDALQHLDEDIKNSQDQRDDDRESLSRALPSTPRRSRSPSKEPFSFHRELGSLSPASASVLSSLAFNSIGQTIDSPSSRSAIEPSPLNSFSAFAPSEGITNGMSTPVRPDGPKRVPSPLKVEVSPRKFRLQSPAPNELANTPARRIPIEQAIAEGQLSPEKAAKIGFKSNNSNSTVSVVNTPARRVLISEKHPTPSIKPRLESPVRPLAAHKESLATTRQIPSLKGKETAVAPASQGTSSSVIKPGSLPFPIVAATSAIVASQEPGAVQNSGSSPTKSALKATSKIPRISKKPYVRKVPEKSTSTPRSTTGRQVDSGKSTKRPIRLVETANILAKPVSRPKSTVSTSSTSTVLLKRKREEIPSPSKPQVTVLRQVPLSTNHLACSNPKTTDNELPPTDQPIYDTIRVRRVATPPPQHPMAEPPDKDSSADDPRPQKGALVLLEGNDLPPASPMKQDHLEEQQPEPLPSASVPILIPAKAPSPVPETETSGLRRTTRPRRPVNVLDSINHTVPRKATRRKPVTHQFDDVFSGMSITALKELTVTNTEKNQHYLAAKLEMEVVRKEGLRPESPAVKIRTITQRQQEEKEQQRAERAKRRARRSGTGDGSTSDVEASSDVGYSSPAEHLNDVDMDAKVDEDGLPKHQRGAGDDEDYETPERRLRDVRARLFDESEDRQPDRRVKWDRGLFTLAYLDEVKLGSRQNLKENGTLKGILAPTSKALRLDTLGNLLHNDTPLTDLVPENVTVKKFVYDNDVPAPEPPAPKVTRSKSKRK